MRETEGGWRKSISFCSLERTILGPKGIGQEIFKDGSPIGPIIVHEKNFEVLAKLVHKLSADTAGCDELVVVAGDRNGDKPSMAI